MKNGTKWLCGLSVVGVIATAVTSAIATRKAVKKLNEASAEIGGDPLDGKTVVKLVGKYYIPPALIICGTVTSIVCAERINGKTIASATAAAALLKKSYDKYGDAVKNVFGIEGDKRVKEEMTHLNGKSPPEKSELYWIGFGYDDYFEAKPSDIERAEYIMNKRLRQGMAVSVADFFDIIGLDPNVISTGWGWSMYELFQTMDDGWLSINLDMIDTDTDRPAYAIDFDCKPTEDFETHQKWYSADTTDRQVPWDGSSRHAQEVEDNRPPWEE